MKLSVIIPVYNTEVYLAKSIGSVLQNRSSDFEVIVVNDGSPGDTGSVLAPYINDQRVKYIQLEKNTGLLHARIVGLAEARGEYVTHVDSDDVVCEGYIDDILKATHDYDEDLIEFNYLIVGRDERPAYFKRSEAPSYTPLDTILNGDISGTVLNKVFKSEILRSALSGIGDEIHIVLGEDQLISLLYMAEAKSLRYINKCIYRYQIRMSSSSRLYDLSSHCKSYDDLVHVYRIVHKKLSSRDDYEALIPRLIDHKISNLNYSITKRIKGNKYQEIIEQLGTERADDLLMMSRLMERNQARRIKIALMMILKYYKRAFWHLLQRT